MNPLVSAVIPTHHRQDLVQRAVRSALGQTYNNLEVVVVIDGPEQATAEILAALDDSRLRVIALSSNVGLSGARNAGARFARGDWIAFLDDDDEWLPEKIASQLALVLNFDIEVNFIGCRLLFAELFRDRTLPRRFPKPGENMGEFIYCRRNFLYPSTFLIRKQLLLDRPFNEELHVNEDCDWLLHEIDDGVLKPVWDEKALVIIHDDISRPHHHEKRDDSNWRLGYEWAIANRHSVLTRKAFSYCLLRLSILPVRRSDHPVRNALQLFYIASLKGRIDLRFLMLFASYVCFSNETRRKIRMFSQKIKPYCFPFGQKRHVIRAEKCTK